VSDAHDDAGRPLDADGRPAVSSLTDEELEEELTVAGMTPRRDRGSRYEQLLFERRRRRAARRDEPPASPD
jgi:hypothetical protein